MTFRLVIVLFILNRVNCAITLECIDGVQEGNCSFPTQNDTKTSLLQPQEISTHTAKPAEKPKALNMVHEDEHMIFSPTVPSQVNEEPKGRSLNFTMDENNHDNGLSMNSTKNGATKKEIDLSDVDMDNDDEENEDESNTHEKLFDSKILGTNAFGGNMTMGICEKGGLTYDNGEKLEVGCDSICTCVNGKMDCVDRCSSPYFRKGKKIDDPLCAEKAVDDHCCAILTCADTATEPLEICTLQNKTYNRGDEVLSDCDEVCNCDIGGKILCKPRCPPLKWSSDRCVEIPDPKDSCCKTVLCDVTLEEHDPEKDPEDKSKHKIRMVKFVNQTTIKIEFENKFGTTEVLPLVEVSNNKINWTSYKLLPGDLIQGFKEPIKYIKIDKEGDVVEIQNSQLGPKSDEEKENTLDFCKFKGKNYTINQEFNDACESLCVCKKSGVKCLKLDCPTYFGVDVIDPTCIEWETVPPHFTPNPPLCCPEKLKCKSNGSCLYEDHVYMNWQEIPSNVTGCQKKCYCEMGKVECQNICPPVTATPPGNLPCPSHHAILDHLPGEDCCMYWMCRQPDLQPGQQNRTTDKSKKGQIFKNEPQKHPKNETDVHFLDPLHPNPYTPSKTLGPLLVYENKDKSPEFGLSPKLSNVSLEENPYFSKTKSFDSKNNKQELGVPYQDVKTKTPFPISKNNKQESISNNSKHELSASFQNTQENSDKNISPYLGPFNPIYTHTSIFDKPSFPTRTDKTRQNETSGTPPDENLIPDHLQPDSYVPLSKKPLAQDPNGIHIHGKGSPEELLQIINQHPEFAQYPPGSVLEIHNIPQALPEKPQYINPNAIIPPTNQHQIVPYIVNQPQGRPVSNLPGSGFTLEQILQDINKNQQKPFPQFPQHFHQTNGLLPNSGHVFAAPQNVPIFNTHLQRNITQGLGFPGAFPGFQPPGFQQPQDEIVINSLEAIDAHTVRLAFNIPPVFVGLHGRVEVRYTHRNDDDQNSWELLVLAPPNDLLETPQLDFDLPDLRPDTEYRIKVTVTLRDIHNTPTSRVYTVRTLKEAPSSTQPPMIPIEPDLAVSDINATWVTVSWRKFTPNELQYIDGVQLRFKEVDGKIYAATPLIHRAVTSYILENLKPNTKYEIGIYFIPFPHQLTELHAQHMVHFTTANEVDNYGFNVSLDIAHIKPTSVEITWTGVPYPEDKYVNIFRAIYQSDSGKGDSSTFKVAKRDSPPKTIIKDLKPGTRYRLWLEVYLTNGRIKTSNVQDFITKPRSAPVVEASHDKLSGDLSDSRGDYYGPLVIVAILAAIAILSTLVLLLVLVKRHSQNKASITPPPRVSQSAYDNPTYKVEIQQETMDL